MDTDDYTELTLIADDGVLISDTFESWRKKSNGIIVGLVNLSDSVDTLVSDVYSGGVTPNFVTLTTAQTITGAKTFGAGTSIAPLLKIGLAGFYYDNTSGINTLTATSTLRSAKLINSGSVMTLRGIDYTLPPTSPSGSKYSFMIANTTGNQMGWLTASDMITGSTLATDSSGRLYVNRITSSELAEQSVGTAQIVNSAVIADKISANAVIADKIAANAVIADKISANAVTEAKIAANAVNADKISVNAVTADKISANAVTEAKIADGAVSATKLNGSQSGTAPVYGARAWVQFSGSVYSNVDGESRCQILASGNVSKVVRSGTGDYHVHYIVPLNSAFYAASTSTAGLANFIGAHVYVFARTQSKISVSLATDSGGRIDAGISVVIFG